MKVIIFAGGVGTRLWPLSRRHSPKQFEKVIGNKSTLQLAVERLTPDFQWKDIYIATSVLYKQLVLEQLPQIPRENIIGEPQSRDNGPAVGLATAILYKKNPHEPIVILWSDYIIRKQEIFKKILLSSEKIISQTPQKIIFISQKPRFASQNLGWIKFSKIILKKLDVEYKGFSGFHYRPNLDEANRYFNTGDYAWNLGYFVTTPLFLWDRFKKLQPEMWTILSEIAGYIGKENYEKKLKLLYSKIPKISFDNAILEKIDKNEAYVVCEDLGWSDIGAWEALKEALQTSPEQNVIKGKVLVTDCQDTLVYNYTDQLLVTIDLNGLLVINTHDVVLVCHKNSVPKIKKLVEKLAESENEHLV